MLTINPGDLFEIATQEGVSRRDMGDRFPEINGETSTNVSRKTLVTGSNLSDTQAVTGCKLYSFSLTKQM